MIAKKELLNLNKKQIELLLNSALNDFNETSIYSSQIVWDAIKHLSGRVEGFQCYNGNQFRVLLPLGCIVGKIGTKSTGEVVPVGELRSKPVKKIGKITITEVNFRFEHFCFEKADDTTWKVKISHGYRISGDDIMYIKNFDIPLLEVLKPENLIKAYDDRNKAYAERENKKFTSFRDEVELVVAQPILKNLFLGYNFPAGETIKKEDLKMFPESHYKSLPETIEYNELFGLIIKTVAEINAELVEEVISKMFSEETI